MRATPLTAAMLSRWLLDSGALRTGVVSRIRVEREVRTPVSTLRFVTVSYSRAAAPRDLPRALVVKTPAASSDAVPDAGLRELEFYRVVAPGSSTPPLARCLAVVETDEDGALGAVVLEDLRATHDHPPWPLPPSRAQCELALDALARVHARWWEAPTTKLGDTAGGRPHTAESLTGMVHGIAARIPAFTSTLGDALTADARHVYARVFASPLRPWLRLTDPRALTVTHGDAHAWNFLFPRAGGAGGAGGGGAVLIDWQLWHLDVGARDLAFFMALHWYPARRRELERPLLEYYHERLVEHGIVGYAFDELLLDYRRGVVRNLTIPILFWSRGMPPEGWWHRLECAVAAYHDLSCDDVL